MVDDKISGKQVIHLMILFLLGSSLVTGGSIMAKQDSWVSVLIAICMAVPVVFIYAGLYKTAPGLDIFDMMYLVFGKIGGAIITVLFCVYTIHLGAVIIKNFSEYVQVATIPETPQVVIALCIGFIAYYNIAKGIEILARGAVFVMPIVIFVIVLLNLFLVKYMNVENLKPAFTQDLDLIFS
ncbi:MAG: hypothetical protein EOM23_08810, partial [Candidatus Moranbacteria bacterium]|nr:hypothetical protein [Candidatus Moranbacteria bacterium]